MLKTDSQIRHTDGLVRVSDRITLLTSVPAAPVATQVLFGTVKGVQTPLKFFSVQSDIVSWALTGATAEVVKSRESR